MRAALVGLLAVLASVSMGCGQSPPHRVSFEIVAWRFKGGSIEVDSQRPGDAGCFVEPRLEVIERANGLHLRVTYRQTNRQFCQMPCPLLPLTIRQPLPAGSGGLPVILDPPQERACGPVEGGPATVPST